MNPIMAAYLAGILELSGWVGMRNGDPVIEILVPRDVAQKLNRATGFGDAEPRGNKVLWTVHDNLAVVNILTPILPHLSMTRRRDVEQVMIQATQSL